MAANLPLQMPAVPEGFCNSLNDSSWIQTLLNLIGQGVAVFEGSGFTVVLNQATAPSAANRDKLWRDTDNGIIYAWDGGAWVSPHLESPSGDVRRMWAGTLADLQTYDGGSVGAVAASSGPMWEEDTAFRGRSPMGPGDIPTSNPAKTLAVDENYGEGAHTQTQQEVGPHTHALTPRDQMEDTGSGDITGITVSGTGPSVGTLSAATNTYTTVQQAMPVIHPVLGIYVVKRTGRINYVGA